MKHNEQVLAQAVYGRLFKNVQMHGMRNPEE
jgi:hypothetical protein